MAQAPPLVVFALIFLSCVVENFFPPSPSDVFVVLAGFLTRQGAMHPGEVFAVAWAGGGLGAIGVYLVARRHSARFRASAAGRRLLPPAATAFMEKEYRRFGALGIALVRILPGFRAVVAPFAGLSGLSAPRALPPMIVASGLWYAGLIWLGVGLGSEWTAIQRRLDGLGRGMWLITGAVVLVIGLVWMWRRRRRSGGSPP